MIESSYTHDNYSSDEMTGTPTPLEKYLFKPLPGSSHSWAMNQLKVLPTHSRVLDFGSGNGSMGQFLQERGVTVVDAVEVSASAREATAPFYRRISASLDDVDEEQYDVILLLDVLEHLVDPLFALEELSLRLKNGGRILISVPNIAHWSIRLSLLFGRFEYTDRGILDRTHLQFFTQKHFLEQLSSVPQCAVVECSGTISPAEFVLPDWMVQTPFFALFSAIRLRGATIFPGLLAYQHVAILEKQESQHVRR